MQPQSFCGAEASKQLKPTQRGPFSDGKEVPRTGMGHTCQPKQFLFSFLKICIHLFICRDQVLWHMESFIVTGGIQCLNQGLNLGTLHWEHKVLVLGPPGKSSKQFPNSKKKKKKGLTGSMKRILSDHISQQKLPVIMPQALRIDPTRMQIGKAQQQNVDISEIVQSQ